jgi:hypothetical protein
LELLQVVYPNASRIGGPMMDNRAFSTLSGIRRRRGPTADRRAHRGRETGSAHMPGEDAVAADACRPTNLRGASDDLRGIPNGKRRPTVHVEGKKPRGRSEAKRLSGFPAG